MIPLGENYFHFGLSTHSIIDLAALAQNARFGSLITTNARRLIRVRKIVALLLFVGGAVAVCARRTREASRRRRLRSTGSETGILSQKNRRLHVCLTKGKRVAYRANTQSGGLRSSCALMRHYW